MSEIQKLLAMLFLKSAPQDLVYSPRSTVQIAVFYVISGVIVLQTTLKPDNMLAGILLGLMVQLGFTYIILAALNKNSRLLQTLSAMFGIGMLFNLIAWPVFSGLADDTVQESFKATMSLLFLLLISWEVLVKAHILKHALQLKMVAALALSFSLFFISVTLSQLLLPATSS